MSLTRSERARCAEVWAATYHPPHGRESIRSANPKVRAIQSFVASWQRSGADERATSLLLDDIAKVLDGTYQA